MAQKPETVFRARADKKLKKIKNSWWESIQQTAIRATPDKIGCIQGYLVALEFKKDADTDLEKLQRYKATKIKAAGGFHFRVTPQNWEKVYRKLIRISNMKPQTQEALCLN